MAKSISVKIGGRVYSLIGDDSSLTQQAAEEVNRHINEIHSQPGGGNIPQSTLTVLAALNLAESGIVLERKVEASKSFLVSEIGRMSSFLAEALQE